MVTLRPTTVVNAEGQAACSGWLSLRHHANGRNHLRVRALRNPLGGRPTVLAMRRARLNPPFADSGVAVVGFLWFNGQMTTPHRKSPRRRVVKIERMGGWGAVRYHHHLKCGHVEIRPRAAKTPKLACRSCLRAEEFSQRLAERSADVETVASNLRKKLDGVQAEVSVERSRAALAKTLSIPVDAVDIVSADVGGTLEIQSALVFLSAEDIARITK